MRKYVLGTLEGDTFNSLDGLHSKLGKDFPGLLLITVGNISFTVMVAVLPMDVLLSFGFTVSGNVSSVVVIDKLVLEIDSHCTGGKGGL